MQRSHSRWQTSVAPSQARNDACSHLAAQSSHRRECGVASPLLRMIYLRGQSAHRRPTTQTCLQSARACSNEVTRDGTIPFAVANLLAPSQPNSVACSSNASRVHDNRMLVSIRTCQASREIVAVRYDSALALSGSYSSSGPLHDSTYWFERIALYDVWLNSLIFDRCR
jgi:hypothetical protein